MTGRLLAEADIKKIVEDYIDGLEGYVSDEDSFEEETGALVADAEHAKTLKAVAEWLKAPCTVPIHNHTPTQPRSTCGRCVCDLVAALPKGKMPAGASQRRM